MDAIKKKMQGMKLEKDNAMDRALLCEQQARDANARAEKAEEEARALQKKIQTIENDLDQTQEALMQVNAKLEEKDKALQNNMTHYETMDHALASSTRRRGHQHHPRHTTRRRLDITSRGPAQCGPAVGVIDNDKNTLTSNNDIDETIDICQKSLDHKCELDNNSLQVNVNEYNDTIGNIDLWPAQCGRSNDNRFVITNIDNKNDLINDNDELLKDNDKCLDDVLKIKKFVKIKNSPEPEHAVARARGDGHSDDEMQNEEDPELVELAKLRCTSERTEVQSEREARRRKRCADYPGLAFGSSIFSSDTMMKFSLIKNELQNIMGNQLKRTAWSWGFNLQ
ncbi:hypothetical protein PV327_005876 [Microctonus hyperodae]|uniref:Tropomyosin n=1 Tax=Microctonus hyperodae TaxID=165561 RepID=A0AA39G299_MICHY|nr:hypothetical protein PV327_005876 [Microctonus hyperodae]